MRLLIMVVCLLLVPIAPAQGPPPPPPPPNAKDGNREIVLDRKSRDEVIELVIRSLNENYIYPEVAKKMEAAVRQRWANGDYNSLNNPFELSLRLTSHLFEV